MELFGKVIQQQHTPAINLIETKLIDGIEGLPLAILLNLINTFVLVDLGYLFLNIIVAVV